MTDLTERDMGVHGSKRPKQAQVLLLGLDGSGKTTLLYKLKYNENVSTVPTVGFNVETLETDRSSPSLTVWDVGGQRRMRPHWKHHYADTAGLVFVVDSWDQRRLDEARKELHRVTDRKEFKILGKIQSDISFLVYFIYICPKKVSSH